MGKQKQKESISSEEEKSERRPKESSTFVNVFRQYADSITALREFFSRLNPLVVEMQRVIMEERKTDIKKIISDFGQRASKEEIEELMTFLVFLKSKGRATKKASKESTSCRLRYEAAGFHFSLCPE
jgi:recombinational DNA repair protein RecT